MYGVNVTPHHRGLRRPSGQCVSAKPPIDATTLLRAALRLRISPGYGKSLVPEMLACGSSRGYTCFPSLYLVSDKTHLQASD